MPAVIATLLLITRPLAADPYFPENTDAEPQAEGQAERRPCR